MCNPPITPLERCLASIPWMLNLVFSWPKLGETPINKLSSWAVPPSHSPHQPSRALLGPSGT